MMSAEMPGAPNWAHALGNHSLFFHLLSALDGQIQPLDAVAEHLQRAFLQEWSHPDTVDLLEGFITLIGYSKRQATEQEYLPFLNVRIHFWIREMTRMVVSIPSNCDPDELASQDESAKLLHSQDLSADSSRCCPARGQLPGMRRNGLDCSGVAPGRRIRIGS